MSKITTCPSFESPEWRLLVDNFTETGAWKFFNAHNGILPDITIIRKIIDLQDHLQELNIEKSLKEAEKSKLKESVDNFFEVIKSQNFKMRFFKNKEIADSLKDEVKGSKVKEILERLKDISSKDIDEHFERIVKGFAISLSQISDITESLNKDLRDKELKGLSPKEQLTYLSNLQSFLGDYKELLNNFRDNFSGLSLFTQEISKISSQIEGVESHINNLRLDPLTEELLEGMAESVKEKDKYFNNRINTIKASLNKAKQEQNESAIKYYQKQLKKEEEAYKKNKLDRAALLEYLKGERGESSVMGFLFKSFESSADPILSGFKNRINNIKNDIIDKFNDIDQSYQRKIKPLFEKLGAARYNVFDFNKQFTTSVKYKDKDGNEFHYLELMDKFNGNWQYDLQELQNSIVEAQKDNNLEKIKEAKLALAKFNQDYMHQPFTKIYYERFNLWDDEIGEETFKRRQLALDEIAEAQRQFNKILELGGFPETEDYLKLRESINKYSRLSSLYNKDGSKKEDMDLYVAQRLQEYNKQTRGLFEYKPVKGAFYTSRKIYSEAVISSGIPEGSPEYESLMKKWDDNNTRYVIKQEFYEEREKILKRINYIMSKVKDNSDKELLKTYSEYHQLILDQIVGYRDEDGQPNGAEISPEKAKEIKNAQEKIEKLKSKIEGISGLTAEEQDELSSFYEQMKSKEKLTSGQLERKRELENKRKSLGFNNSDKKLLFDSIDALKELQSRQATDYYIDALNQVSQKLGMDFDATTAEELLSSKELDTFLKDKDFKEWWDKNHILTEKWDSNVKMKVPVYERIAIWNRIVPNDNKYLESITLEDGEVLYRQPAKQYFYRDVKDQYKTKEIVGETVDNKGNWLPKSYNKKGDLDAKDDKYINKEYYQLIEDAQTDDQAKAKLDLLELRKKTLLSFQDHIPYKDRLYLQIPSIWKSKEERLRRNDVKGIYQNIKEKFNTKDKVHIDEEATNVIENTDIFGNPIYDIPVKYTGKMSEDNVSLDIDKAIMLYGLSTETKKQLQEELPVLKALQSTLKKYGIKKENTISSKNIINKGAALIGVKSEDNWRLKGINALEEEYFRGIYNRGLIYFDEESNVSRKIREYVFNPLARLSAFKSLGFDYVGSITNSAVGNIQSHFDAVGSRSFSNSNLVKGEATFITEVIPDLLKDNLENLAEQSFWGKMIVKFNPEGKSKEKIGHRFSATAELSAIKNIAGFLENPREFGELQISVSQMIAILDTIEVEDDKGNKKSIIDAYKQGYADNNGEVLEIEKGFKFSKFQEQFLRAKIHSNIENTQGNYNPQSRTQLERSVVGKMFFFMRKYLIAQLEDSFGGPKHSYAFGMKQGTHTSLLNFIKTGLNSIKDKNNYYEAMTPLEINQAYKLLVVYTSLIALYLLISNLDPDDDKDSPKTTQDWDWSRIQLLLQALRIKDELEQNTLLGIKEISKNFLSPTTIEGYIFKLFKLINDFGLYVTNDEKATYSRGVRNSEYMQDLYGSDIKAVVDFRDLIQGNPNTLEGLIPGSDRSTKEAAYKLLKKSEQQRFQ